MKWLTILQRLFYDVFLLGFGTWIIWKQVEATTPNVLLGAIGFGMIFPAARSAITSILSGSGLSSSSSQPPSPPDSSHSPQGGSGDGGKK